MYKNILFFSIFMLNILFCSVDEYIKRINEYIEDGKYLKANEEFELALKEYDASASLYFIGGKISIKIDRHIRK